MTDPIAAADSAGGQIEHGLRLDAEDDALFRNKMVMRLTDVNVSFAGKAAVRGVTFDIHGSEMTALIGPSGSGKTTLLRALNRMHDEVQSASVTGKVLLGGTDIYSNAADVNLLRSRVGMVFQQPNPFPSMSIFDNAVAGLKFNGVHERSLLDEAVESPLVAAALWDSVRDRLKARASTLSGGEQQRLCAGASSRAGSSPDGRADLALDPVATELIEELLGELKDRVAIVIVTHNMEQAARISDRCAFLLMAEDMAGELIEFGPTAKLFSEPTDHRTLDYVNGRFG